MEYKVVHTMFLKDLTAQINALLAEGWRPQGGISGTEAGNWAQAVIRESPDNGSGDSRG